MSDPAAAAAPAAAPRTDRSAPALVTRTVRDIVRVVPDWVRALTLALAALFALALLLAASAARRSRRLARQRAVLQEEVGLLQAALLPEVPTYVGGLAVSVAYRPAEGLAAGGDFYDVFPLDGERVGIVVGDVSGHGRDSLAPATFLRHMVRSYLEAGLSPRGALWLAGRVVDEHRGEEFATVVAAVHDAAAGTLAYATAGHPPPIFTGPGAHMPLTVASSPPIGVGSATGLRQTTLPLRAGSTVCFFTDGLVEARRGGGLYGMDRLERAVRELGPLGSAQDLVDRVAGGTDRFADDIAACLIRAQTGSAAGAARIEEIEVTAAELGNERVRRFLEACDLDERDIDDLHAAVAPEVARAGSCVLRVRVADGRSGVDLLPGDHTDGFARVRGAGRGDPRPVVVRR